MNLGMPPKAVSSATFRIFGVDLQCHVLDTGQRIIEADSMAALLEAMESSENYDIGELEDFHRWKDAT